MKSSTLSWKILIAAIFLAPLRAYGLSKVGPFIISGYKICMLFMIITYIFSLSSKQIHKVKIDNFVVVSSFLILYDIVTFLHSPGVGLFGSYVVSHIVLLFAFLVAIRECDKFENLIFSFVISSIIPSLIGIYQWIGVSKNGITPPLPMESFVIEEGKNELFLYGNYRVVSTLQDPSYLGLYLSSVVIIGVGVLFLAHNKFGVLKNLLMLFSVIVTVFCLLMTGSVSSYINVIVGIVVINLYYLSKKRVLLKPMLFLFAMGCFLMFFFINKYNYNPVDVLMYKLSVQGDENNMYGRAELMTSSINDWLKSPIWGVGFEGMTYSSAHNSYLTILALQGIVGLFFNVYLLFGILISNLRNVRDSIKFSPYTVLFTAALLGMLFQINGYDCLYKMDSSVVILIMFFVSLNNSKIISSSNV